MSEPKVYPYWPKEELEGAPRTRECVSDSKKTIGQLCGDLERLCATLERELAAAIRASVDERKAAMEEIAAERKRQIEVEGWDAEHDDLHDTGGLAMAAACYAAPAPIYKGAHIIRPSGDRDGVGPQLVLHSAWPWDPEWWKPKDRRRDLIRAAALIVAEIERLARALSSAPKAR